MLRPSKKMLFAIEAVLDIAYHAGGEPVQSREITRRQGIPRRYLEQTLQYLVRSDILIGVRGPHGGYRLARERRRISVGEIVRVVRSMEVAEDMFADVPASELGKEVIRPMWGDLQEEVMRRLDAVSIDDLCQRAHRGGLASEAREKMDFNI
ncbi:MAG: Rrf2 family transcriptional regulator [Alphaproteobacteria bacterium]|nr:Rrf2 family transcriptional regulator [Alphaproteobacteria bacterium]